MEVLEAAWNLLQALHLLSSRGGDACAYVCDDHVLHVPRDDGGASSSLLEVQALLRQHEGATEVEEVEFQ